MTRILLFIIVFLVIGLFYCMNLGSLNKPSSIEGLNFMESEIQRRMCGNLLVKEGNKIKLYNSNTSVVPGVNPIVFNNLEEYSEFFEWLKSQNIQCPALLLQESYNTQGNKTYLPSGNMDFLGAVSDDLIQLPYEGSGQSAVDTGITNENKSPFATDVNWGGPGYSKQLLDEGAFDGDKVFVKR